MKRTVITKVNLYVDIVDFFNFLSEHNALILYLNELKKRPELRISEFFLESATPENWLSGAFGWAANSQGYDYWQKLNSKWHAVLYDGLDSSKVTIKASGK